MLTKRSCFVVLGILVIHCAIAVSDDAVIESIQSQIKSVPSWSAIGGEAEFQRDARQIEARVKALRLHSLADMRAAIARLCKDKTTDSETRYTIFVVTKGIFAIPDSAAFERASFEGLFDGGWHGVPHGNDTLLASWPWSVVDGDRHLTHKFMGYTGPRFDCLKIFDYCAAKFPREPAK